jgi:3-phenylpropionate/trans-cinnamate dioxygenase ferredoxin reductase component
MPETVLIVGAGQGGAQVAMSLRQGGFSGRLVVIGEEPYLPYQRPPLSKKFLSAPRALDTLLLRPEGFWHKHQVEFLLGTPVLAVDCNRRTVVLGNGCEFAFEALVFATGTSARQLRIPGIGCAGVFSLRQIDDLLRLRPALSRAGRIVIVGAGYIGLEVAATLVTEGRRVTVLEAESRVLKRVTGESVSAFYDRLHRDRGVDIRVSAPLAAVEGADRVVAVRTTGGERFPADVVLIAAGARARDDLALAAGLSCQDGILVDAAARTDRPGIYAVGDCTRFPSRRYGRLLRLESVQNAIDQAKAAAASILGDPPVYDPVPWFWSDQYELKLQMAGLCQGYEAAEVIGETISGRFAVEYRCADRLIAVDAVNDARAHMLARRRIAEETAN